MLSPELPQPHTIQPIVDPSAAGMPAWLTDGYKIMNDNIARDRQVFGGLLQIAHLSKSWNHIRATAQTALQRAAPGEERNALILGPGGCFDLPLEDIVTDFDKTVLLDVDTPATERALSSLPPRLLGKVSLQKCDITGAVAKLGIALDRAGESDYDQFIDEAAAAVRATTVQSPIEGKHTFVASQLVMTQLGSIPFLNLSTRMKQQYGRPLSMRPNGPDVALTTAIRDCSTAMQTGHIKQLSHLAKPHGTVHLADTVIEVVNGQNMPMASLAAIEEIDKHFTRVAPADAWTWQPVPHRLFQVLSYSLAPKAPSA